ncbi:zinc ribbon domain-containing protein [Paenibacillus camerounensis]|uniref:zinc ribbon domain-containing protein n=1 Tax=Paenibacillus camerounensis TaxID=1243663 RepID=UPI000A603524|nr:zinc ribbon domain-containing protein [Paenibacillus camerounensis]
MGVFGIFWTIMAIQMGAPIFFAAFGIIFVGLAIGQAIYHFKNATGENRMSLLDITEANEEPDPLDRFLQKSAGPASHSREFQDDNSEHGSSYCPYCGSKVTNTAYQFCPKCGKALES